MQRTTDDYNPPVGFAREPTVERRRWAGRVLLVLFVIGIGWMIINNVLSPEDTTTPTTSETPVLPAPR